jgi:hypothetical protein
MARALAYVRQVTVDPAEIVRAIVVAACALALIAAGQALPF